MNHKSMALRALQFVLPGLVCIHACSGDDSPAGKTDGNSPSGANTQAQVDLTSPPSGPKVKPEEAAIRAMLEARFGRIVRGVRIKVENDGGDVRVQLRGDVPSEEAREAIMRETAARVEGLRTQDFDLTVSGPVPMIGFFETRISNNTGTFFTRDLRIAAVLDDNPMGMPDLLDLWAKKRINKLASVERKAMKVLAISNDGKKLATGHINNMIVLWNLPQGENPVVLERSRDLNKWDAPAALAFSPDGKLLAYVLADGGEVWLRALDDTRENRLLGKHEAGQMKYGLAFSPDGSLLATADTTSKSVQLWDVKSRTRKRELPLSQVYFEGMAWSPDGKTIAVSRSTGQAGTLLLNVDDGKSRILSLPESSNVQNIVFAPDGKTLAIRFNSLGVVLWDLATDKEWTRLDRAKIGDGNGLAFSADGSVLAVAHAGQFNRSDDPSGIQFWDVSQRPGANGTGGEFPPAKFEPIAQREDALTRQITERIRTFPGMRDAKDVAVEVQPNGSIRLKGTVPHMQIRDDITRDIERRFPATDTSGRPSGKRQVINEMRTAGR